MTAHATPTSPETPGSPEVAITRSNQLATKRDIWRAFRTSPSGRVIVPVVIALVVVRLVVGDWGRGDLVVAAMVAIATGPVEWVIHKFLLHAEPTAWTSRKLGTGSGHREHHLDPPELRWLLLPGADAALFLAILGLITCLWVPAFVWMFGGVIGAVVGDALVAPTITALVVTAAALAHYEWTHLLVHTTYRPHSRFYARLARNHRRHHYRNERYWLGITSNLGDRILRTYPSNAGDVPVSGTARTLGDAPVD